MRIAPGLTIDELPGGCLRLRAADWPFAMFFAVPALVTGVPLVVWAAAEGQWIELGGGLVFAAFGAVCARLGLKMRRDLEVRPASIRGSEGVLPFRSQVAFDWAGSAFLLVRPFPVPEGAPDLSDRGGDLVLSADAGELLLARRVGPSWRHELETARARVEEVIRRRR